MLLSGCKNSTTISGVFELIVLLSNCLFVCFIPLLNINKYVISDAVLCWQRALFYHETPAF